MLGGIGAAAGGIEAAEGGGRAGGVVGVGAGAAVHCRCGGDCGGGGTEPQPRDRDSIHHGGLALPIAGGLVRPATVCWWGIGDGGVRLFSDRSSGPKLKPKLA